MPIIFYPTPLRYKDETPHTAVEANAVRPFPISNTKKGSRSSLSLFLLQRTLSYLYRPHQRTLAYKCVKRE